MVTNRIQHSGKKAVKQGSGAVAPEASREKADIALIA
jgi:hypothetical protein